MTDDQLCEHVDRQFTAGFDAARVGIELHNDKIIEAITGVKGIGATTLEKIRAAIEQATGGGGGDKPTTNNL
jgi:alanine-alpha-ketoisovalerate/valine-pyruvate aminotransferase